MNRDKLYIAAPLFSDAEKDFNRKLASILSQVFDVYLPQRDGNLLVNLLRDGMEKDLAIKTIFRNDIRAIESAGVLLIILDGRTIDEGAAFELGVAFALNKKCYAIRTDPRQLLPSGNNPMIENAIINTFNSVEDLCLWVDEIIKSGNKETLTDEEGISSVCVEKVI